MITARFFLPLAWLLSHGIGAVVSAADIEVCTQVTKDFVENGDFTTTSAWTTTSSSDKYSIVTTGGLNGGSMLEIPYSTSENGFEFEQIVAVQEGPYYQLHSYWNLFGDQDSDGAYPYCSMNVYAVTDETTEFVTYGDIWSPDGSATGWGLVLGQWQSQVSEVTLKFRITCSQASSSTLQISGISLLGPEAVCTSQCATSTTTLTGELVQDGSFTDDDSTEWLDTECSTNLHLVDDDAPGGGQCVYIPGSDYDFYQINQTVADAQVGQTYNASVSWRLKSDEYNADVPVTCSIDYRLSNGDTGLLLDIAHETVTVSSTDSGWMAVNGTWDATVSDFTIMITVQCSTEDTDYLPDIEIANVRLNIQIVSCPVQRSSSAVASSTQVSSTTPPRTPISSAVVSPTPVSHLAVPSSSFHATSLVLASSSVAVNRSRVASSLSDYPVSSVSPSVSVSRSRVAASSSSLVSSAIAVTTPVTIPIFIPGLSSAVPSPASSLSSNVASSHILTPGQPGRPLTSILATNPLPTASQSAKLATVPAGSDMTTSTIFTTSTVTITSCPSTITDCPASKRTTYLTTETILVSTTVCPITAAATATATDDGSYTSTILTTRTTTITSCAATVTNCPARSQTTYISTQTLVAGTTIIFTGKTIPAQTALPGTTNVSSGSNDAPVTTGPHGAGVNIAGSQGTPTDSSTTTAAPGTVAAASANAVAPEKPWPHVSSASSEIGSFGSTGSSSLDASSSSGSESRVAGSSASGVSASGSNGSGPSNSSSDYGSCIFSGSPSDSSSGPACCYTSDSDSGHISTELSGLSNYSTSGSAIGSTGPSRPSGSGDSRSRTGTSSAGSFASVSGSESFNSGSASASYDSSNSGSHNTAESTGQTPPNSDMDLTATSATGITGEYNGSSSPKTLTTSVESTSTTAEIPSTNSNSPINGNNVAAVSDGSSPIAGSSYGSSSGQNFPAGYGFSTRPAISSSVASMTPANSATAQASSTTSSAVGAVFTGAASAVPIQNLVLAAVAMVVGVILL